MKVLFDELLQYANIEFSLQEGMAYDLIIATTKIVNGNTLADTYIDKLG